MTTLSQRQCFRQLFLVVITLFRPILSAVVECFEAFECANSSTPTPENDKIYSYGYKSYYGSLSTLISKSDVDCFGAFSCTYASSIIAWKLSCTGSNACAQSQSIRSDKSIKGYGVNALTSANIYKAEELNCYGEQSCAYATIEGCTYIEGWGAFSLLNAVIDSTNATGSVDIYLRGYYAGFGANIRCRAGDHCDIHCAVNACTNLNVRCDDNCELHIYYASSDTLRAINHSWIDIESIMFYDTSNITNTLDKECSSQPDNMNYDDYNEAPIGDITESGDGPLCCRGRSSCEDATNVDYTSYIVSSGKRALENTNINTRGSIFCDASYACTATINITETVYCTARRGCYHSIIRGASTIYCGGCFSCYGAVFLSDGSDIHIYFLGRGSGKDARITCSATDRCFIWCYGYESCENTTIMCDGEYDCSVYCDADSLCPHAWNATVKQTTQSSLMQTTTIADETTANPTSMSSSDETTINPSSLTSSDETTANPSSLTTADETLISKNPSSIPTSAISSLFTTTVDLSTYSQASTTLSSQTYDTAIDTTAIQRSATSTMTMTVGLNSVATTAAATLDITINNREGKAATKSNFVLVISICLNMVLLIGIGVAIWYCRKHWKHRHIDNMKEAIDEEDDIDEKDNIEQDTIEEDRMTVEGRRASVDQHNTKGEAVTFGAMKNDVIALGIISTSNGPNNTNNGLEYKHNSKKETARDNVQAQCGENRKAEGSIIEDPNVIDTLVSI